MIPAQSSGAAYALVVELARQGIRVPLVDDSRLRVPAVVIPSREPRSDAQVLVAAHAEAEHTPGRRATQPGDPHTVAHREALSLPGRTCRLDRRPRGQARPRIVGGSKSPSARWRSVRQTPHTLTATRISPAAGLGSAAPRALERMRGDRPGVAHSPCPHVLNLPAAKGGAISSREGSEREGSDAFCVSWNRSTLRNDGNSFDHVAATTRVIAPPNTTVGPTPRSCPATPDSNAPSSSTCR